MPVNKGSNLDFEDRCTTETMIHKGESFRQIARTLNVSPSTISDEIIKNRSFSEPRASSAVSQSRKRSI